MNFSTTAYFSIMALITLAFTAVGLLLNILGTRTIGKKLWLVAVIFGAVITFDQLKERLEGEKQASRQAAFMADQAKFMANQIASEHNLIDTTQHLMDATKQLQTGLEKTLGTVSNLQINTDKISKNLQVTSEQIDAMPSILSDYSTQLAALIQKYQRILEQYNKSNAASLSSIESKSKNQEKILRCEAGNRARAQYCPQCIPSDCSNPDFILGDP